MGSKGTGDKVCQAIGNRRAVDRADVLALRNVRHRTCERPVETTRGPSCTCLRFMTQPDGDDLELVLSELLIDPAHFSPPDSTAAAMHQGLPPRLFDAGLASVGWLVLRVVRLHLPALHEG